MSGLEIIESCFTSFFNTTNTFDPVNVDSNTLSNIVCGIALTFFAAKSVYDSFSWSRVMASQPSIEKEKVEEMQEEDFTLIEESYEPKPLSEKLSDPLNVAVIEKINQAREEGKKVILVIGRHDAEPLPQDEENAVYISLDEQPRAIIPPAEGRLHLQMDFNSKHDFSPLHGLFDTVIVDFSTLKFLDNWDILKPLLHPNPNSTLITELPTVCYSAKDDENKTKRLENLRRPHFYIPSNEFRYPRFAEQRKKIQLTEKTKYLKTLFGSVEILENAPYPTRTKQAFGQRHPLGQGLTANLFVMTNPLPNVHRRSV
ncbi:MAG: hypothetical protein KDK56_05855 [Simkania sp.]|nr:hypothetical protein [Simkania sp.]MCB1074282.1 hypothetical protein [Simkania sp.]MCP5490602.1 hypothetical protein [Chlamydiales bacterium]